jgi:cytochrome b561
MIKDSPYHYGLLSRALHWTIAVLILANLALGLLFDYIQMPAKISAINIHKAIGVTVLVLMVLRLVWRSVQGFPREPDGLPKWQQVLARAVHLAFYPLLIALPLAGWLASSAAGYPVNFFGLFTLPLLPIEKDKALSHVFNQAHSVLAYITIALVAIHIGAALWHHFVEKQKIIRRIL